MIPSGPAFRYAHSALVLLSLMTSTVSAQTRDIDRLIDAVSGETPLYQDLRYLTDVIGGRTTGSEANVRSVEWTLGRFRQAGVTSRTEAFPMPRQWVERATRVEVYGTDVRFAPRAVAKPYASSVQNLEGALIDIGLGTAADFQRTGNSVKGAWVFARTRLVTELGGLFGEYEQALEVETLASEHGALGIIYMSPRSEGVLHRLVQFSGIELPAVFVERQQGQRLQRLLEARSLRARVTIDARISGPFESHNVIGEIGGSDLRNEVVLIGAHLDSHNLGTGAIDDAGNVTILMDIARQMIRLDIRPRRTIRFVLWNGEEQGFHGSWNYTVRHKHELANHVLAASIDVGEGPIVGFFTNGRGAELKPLLDRALEPVADLGPFEHPDAALVGTDNYDFLLNGVANLIGNQNSIEVGLHYHAETDNLDKLDPAVLKRNAAILAALVYGFATMELSLPRQSEVDTRALIERLDMKPQMEMFGVYRSWLSGERAWTK